MQIQRISNYQTGCKNTTNSNNVNKCHQASPTQSSLYKPANQIAFGTDEEVGTVGIIGTIIFALIFGFTYYKQGGCNKKTSLNNVGLPIKVVKDVMPKPEFLHHVEKLI